MPKFWRFQFFCTFAPLLSKRGAIAQLVEQRTENPCVPGSIPGGTTSRKKDFKFEVLFSFLRARRNFCHFPPSIILILQINQPPLTAYQLKAALGDKTGVLNPDTLGKGFVGFIVAHLVLRCVNIVNAGAHHQPVFG